MAATRSARALSIVVVAFLGACATAQRAPSLPSATVSADAGATDDVSQIIDAGGDSGATAEDASVTSEAASPCPKNMALVATDERRFCIDVYEGALVELDSAGNEASFPHWLPVDGHTVRAISEPDVFPQGFISEVQADDACTASGKRLCTYPEWKTACMGPSRTTFPYGDQRQPGVCHDTGRSAVVAVFGARAFTDPVARAAPTKKNATAKGASARGPTHSSAGRPAHATTKGRAAETVKPRATRGAAASRAPTKKAPPTPAKRSKRPTSVESSVWAQLNDPRLGRIEGALAKTGSHAVCESGYGVFDIVGNLHEWVKTDPSSEHGVFAGGYYLDTALNGDGCQYRTTAHAHDYHDYSTGFRCCAEAAE